jgi:molybdopterin molybdotransferase
VSAPLPLAEAQRRLLDGIVPLGSERIGTGKASGRILAEPLVAARTQPAADLSAMDGYGVSGALRSEWRVVGESAAGHPYAAALRDGEAVRISTGAMLPPGADAVLLQENAQREREQLTLNGDSGASAQHIRRKGFDFRAGELLLPAGTRLGPVQLALALAAGQAEVAVHRRPRLIALDTGDELVADPGNCAVHQLPASNAAMVAALAAPLVREARVAAPVPDRLEALVAAFAAADDADVIVTSGGASVGDHDLLRPALAAWGAEVEFWRVAMKPGKPLLYARKGDRIVLGLPGNPVSSFVTAYFFLLPLLRRLGGWTECQPRSIIVPLTTPLPKGGPRLEFIRGLRDPSGVTPLGERDSSALRTLAAANVLIERPIEAAAAAAGDSVPVYCLDNGGIA